MVEVGTTTSMVTAGREQAPAIVRLPLLPEMVFFAIGGGGAQGEDGAHDQKSGQKNGQSLFHVAILLPETFRRALRGKEPGRGPRSRRRAPRTF
jgi:hypothetical protein